MPIEHFVSAVSGISGILWFFYKAYLQARALRRRDAVEEARARADIAEAEAQEAIAAAREARAEAEVVRFRNGKH